MFAKRSCFRVTVDRHAQRQERSLTLAEVKVQDKIGYARQFADQNVIIKDELVYTTATDLIKQESNAIALH